MLLLFICQARFASVKPGNSPFDATGRFANADHVVPWAMHTQAKIQRMYLADNSSVPRDAAPAIICARSFKQSNPPFGPEYLRTADRNARNRIFGENTMVEICHTEVLD
jgi:hypothetical protein